MHITTDRKGTVTIENSMQDRFLKKLYHSVPGRMLLRPLTAPVVSKIGGMFLDSGISRFLTAPFIRKHAVCMEEYERRKYRSFNEFFKRKILPGARTIEWSKDCLVSPCDSRLSVYRIAQNKRFCIKHTEYTVESLLRSRKLAEAYAGGYIWVFRLCVDDYHRYIYIDDGMVSRNHKIPGIFHTVNPIANDFFPVYKENSREYVLLKTKNFGTVVQMEVGALLVGKIENRSGNRWIKRGEEKGNFAFGGSTVILMTQKGKVRPDPDILKNSMRGIETKVLLGEKVGMRNEGK